jgi:ABC-type lipoprotein export system ATPase subunit
VAIARALANDPAVILADEPTGNLDSKNAQQVFDIFKRLVELNGQTVIVITHEMHLAQQAHRRIRLIDGLIAEDG